MFSVWALVLVFTLSLDFMALLYSTEVHFENLGILAMWLIHALKLYVASEQRALAEEQPLPEALHCTSLLMRALCLLALGRPDLSDHWKSLQSEQAFETVRSRLCSILASTITTVSCPLHVSSSRRWHTTPTKASVLLAISGVFVSTGSPVSYFDYTSPIPYCLLIISLMLAMIAMLTSGSSMIRWLCTDRHWTQEVRVLLTIPIAPTNLNIMNSNLSPAATSSYSTCCQ
jgi:hypothetical protein